MTEQIKPRSIHQEYLPNDTLEKRWEVGMSSKIREALTVKEGEDLPHLKFKVFYSAHNSAEDVKGFGDECKEADIIIPEFIGWNQEYLDHLNRISQGTEDLPKEIQENTPEPNDPFGFYMYRVVHNTKKPIIFIDLPEGDPLVKKLEETQYPDVAIDTLNPFEDYIKSMRDALKNGSLLELEREKYMIHNLKERIQEVLENNPSLKKKDQLKILIQLGAFHTRFYHMMSDSGEDISRKFSDNPYIFEFEQEASRRFYFGLDVSDDLMMRVLYEMNVSLFFRPTMSSICADYHKLGLFHRKLVSLLSIEEIRNALKNGITPDLQMDAKILMNPLIEKLDPLGIDFPKNEKELDEFIARKI